MKVVIVLSGGGAKGAYQVGALSALYEMGLEPHVKAYTGVSVGSLNSALAAQVGMGNLHDIWKDIRSKHVYKKYGKIRSAWRLIRRGGSRSSKPLRKLIAKHIRVGMGKMSYAGASDMDMGAFKVFSSMDPNYLKGLEASSAIPAVIPPVVIDGRKYWDGGVLNMTPLGHALSLAPDALVIITCNPYPGLTSRPVEGKLEGLELVKRTVSMLVEEGFESDIREFIYRNSQEGYRNVPFVLISPTASIGDVDDFSENSFNWRYQVGVEDAIAHEPEIMALFE